MIHRLDRFDRRATVLVAAIALAYAAASDAAEQRGSNATTQAASSQTQTQSSTRAQASSASSGAAAPMNAQAVRDLRISDVIGMDVRNSRGENLGDVKDLVVDTESGRIAYAVVGIGGFLGIGEKLSAFPMSSFKVSQASTRTGGATTDRSPGNPMDNDGVRGDKGPAGSDRAAATPRAGTTDKSPGNPLDNDGVPGDKGPIGTDRVTSGTTKAPVAGTANRALPGRGSGDLHLVLDADPQRLKDAPNFDGNQWPDWNDAKYRSDVDRAAGVTGTTKVGRLLRGSEMLDADIQDAKNQNVGEIEDIIVDVRAGQARYAVVDFDQAWTPNDKLVAVPMKALRASSDEDELVFSGDRSQIARAPSFDKDQWPDLNASTYRGSVDRYMSGWGGTTDPNRSAPATGSGTTTR